LQRRRNDTPNDNGTPSYVLFRRSVAHGAGAYEGNILSGRERINTRGAPTEVTVFSGTARGAQVSARTMVTTANASILDDVVTRGLVLQPPPAQPRYVSSPRSRTPERASQDASNTILDAMASFRVYECTVRGHGQTVDGARRLYALNTIARVRDDVAVDSQGRPLDEDMLITSIRFRRSRQAGTTTTLTLVPRGALALTPTET
jgi:prophage tail gpP-like protein